MAALDDREIKIFKLNRIKFNELYQDALRYVKSVYNSVGQNFTPASPFGQLLTVVLNLGRMIFYYIEDSITGLNIRTAYRPDQVRGLAILAGHDSARSIAARGAIKITYKDKGTSLNGNVAYIPNKTKIISKINGFDYVILFGAEHGRITCQAGNALDACIVQGKIKMQYVTGTGQALQSYNFVERNFGEVDQFYTNVYVNSEPWEIVSSIQDLGFNQKGCVVRTGINGGLDVFFGNGDMGAIPPQGSYIVCEYLLTQGGSGNISKVYANQIGDAWQWNDNALLPDGTQVALEGNFNITLLTDIIFGTMSEDLALTQLIAPHVSRSFVLANETNYRYFFKRMNMFSDVEIIRGSYSVNGTSVMQLAYDQAERNYKTALFEYQNAINQYGESDTHTMEAYQKVNNMLQIKNYAATKLSDNTYRDNTIYIMLIPDITKRIGTAQNYFTCDESLFYLSELEQENILNLINASGQRIITVENRILQPKVVRFSVNVQAKIWDNYEEETVYANGLAQLSKYFINYNRQDIIPASDIVSIFENNVEGIDSVKVWFDADVNNQDIYGAGNYGLDKFGDIVLTREAVDANGQVQSVRDMMPLIRGGFTSPEGVEYSNIQTKDGLSAYNLIITGRTSNRKVNLNNYTALT